MILQQDRKDSISLLFFFLEKMKRSRHVCLLTERTLYHEANMDRFDDRDDVRTNLINSYDRLTNFICHRIDDKFFLEGTQRISVRSIIAREIESNILMHREYSSPYPAKVIIEKGRIQTENANKTYHYRRILATTTPYLKNSIIAKFFNNIGRADELGSGVRNLYKYTKMYSDGEPALFEDGVFLEGKPLSGIATADKAPITAYKPPINHQQSLILDHIKENGSICNTEACNIINLKSTRVKERLREMVNIELHTFPPIKIYLWFTCFFKNDMI